MLSSVFGKSFNAGKCKTLLRLAISRIKLLRNKREMQLKQMRRELGQLLQAKQELTARIRVEHVFREQNIMAAYEIMELFSELLVVRLPIIESQRQCPIDLREAIASLIFAAPRCADLPELQQISSLFVVKYGKDFVAAAAELRPDCGVSRLVIEKLSVRAPSGEVRLKLMKEIAEEQGVDWDAAASEAEYQKGPEDLLDGPNRFMGSSMHFHAPVKEPTSSIASDFYSQNEAGEDDTQSIPFTLPDPPSACQNQSAPSIAPVTKKNVRELADHELARDEDYKDAADAARAAALSAERAAAAAIAVASLAKENFARMHSDLSKRSNSEQALASDEDDYRKETIVQMRSPKSKPRDDYFGIRVDSFDAHLMDTAEMEAPGDISITAKPLFDEYPEEEVRYTRAHKGAPRSQPVVEDYTSDEFESDSTERSDSPPLYRRGEYDDGYATHKGYRQSTKENGFHQSSTMRRHVDIHIEGRHDDRRHADPCEKGFQDDQRHADPSAKGFIYDNGSMKEPPRFKADDRGLHHDHQRIKEPLRFDADETNLEQRSRMQMHDEASYRKSLQDESQTRGLSAQRGRGGGHSGGPPQRRPPNPAKDAQIGPNTAPYVHPKLPNYDDLSARFEALRSRR